MVVMVTDFSLSLVLHEDYRPLPLTPSICPLPTLFLYSSSAKKMLLEISSSISPLFLTHARPYTHIPSLINPFPSPWAPPCCSVHQAVRMSVCRALAIVRIWPKKKCVQAERDADGRLRE
jgi:hypothetical protein